MNIHRAKLVLALVAVFAFHAPKTEAATNPPANTNFFSGATSLGDLGNGFTGYYIPTFNYYANDTASPKYYYKFNFGFLYFFGPYGTDLSSNEAYFYDFTAGDYLYTSTSLYPYFYSFNLSSFLYYFESSNPREFYEFKTGSFIKY